MFIATGVALAGALGLAIFLTWLDVDYSRQTTAYDAAQACTSTANLSGCRYTGPGVVSRKWSDNGDPHVELTFGELGGAKYSTLLDKSHTARWDNWHEGATLNAELWMGKVTTVDGVPTVFNPDALPNAGPVPALVFGVASLGAIGILVWLVVMNRRAARAASCAAR